MATKKTKADEVIQEVEAKEAEASVDPMEEYVEIELFKDGGKYKDDVYVSVNGETCLVQRGVPVKIKRKFAEVIQHSIEQNNHTASEILKLTTK
ncbi:MAG: hypothetical protein J6N19_02155 [Clostridium sp.]|nr:hypothetical protein [Clostridium sp.]